MLLINDRSVSILVGGAHKSLHALEALIASTPPCLLRVLSRVLRPQIILW